MNTLTFETGLVTYSLNGACEVRFNPTDSAFAQRLFTAFDALEQKQEGYQQQAAALREPREIFAFARERDREMRELLDRVLGAPVCDALFGEMDLYAMAGGLPVWCNLLLALMDEMEAALARERKASDPRLRKYLDRYRRQAKR